MADKGENVPERENVNDEKQSEIKESAKETKPVDDNELNDLLDSALEDFDEVNSSKAEGSDVDKAGKAATPKAAPPSAGATPTPIDFSAMLGQAAGMGGADAMTEEMADKMAEQFEEAMKSFMSQEPGMMEQISKLAESTDDAGEPTEVGQEFAQTLAQTLSGLAENAESLQQHQISPEDLTQAFGNMNMGGAGSGGGGGPGGEMFPMMQGMMKLLLSKDVLYPSLKEIADKYPAWLEEHKETEEKSSWENYKRQHELISAICVAFESETPTDSDEAKTQRFDKLMDLMQKMQELGQPPKEIVGDMAPGLQFDEDGMPKLPGMTDQCTVM